MSAEVVNVGYSGLGKHAEWSHIKQQAADPNAAIKSLYDTDGYRLTMMQPYVSHGMLVQDAAIDTDDPWNRFVTDPELDAIYVITPDRFHTQQLLDVLAAGKHAFVEKPLADTWEDYERLKEALQVTPEDIVISTCHPRRFDSPFMNTKILLEDRELLAASFGLSLNTDIGPVKSFSLALNYSRPTKTGLHTSFASDHLPHEVDTASHLFGLQGLSYAVSHVNEELAFDVEAVREDGIELRFTGNRLQSGKQYCEDWKIGFENGVVLSVDAHTGSVALTDNDRPIGGTWRPQNSRNGYMFITDYDRRFDALNRNFIASIQGKEASYITRQEMLMNTVVALALQEVDKPVTISADGEVSR